MFLPADAGRGRGDRRELDLAYSAGMQDLSLALAAGAVVAAIELPISQHYATVPATSTPKRMVIAGAMAAAGVLVAGAILRSTRR